MQLLQYGHPLTGAAPTALPVVQGGIEPVKVCRQTEVQALWGGKIGIHYVVVFFFNCDKKLF